jgi:hypothetical protein
VRGIQWIDGEYKKDGAYETERNRQNSPVWIRGARSGSAGVSAESAIDRAARGGTKLTVIAGTARGGVEAIFPLERDVD